MTFPDETLAVFVRHSELSFHGLVTLANDELAKARRALESASPTEPHTVARFQAQIATWKALLSLPTEVRDFAVKATARQETSTA